MQITLSIRRKHHSFGLCLRTIIFACVVWQNGRTLVTINDIIPIVNVPCAAGVYDFQYAVSSSSS